MAKQTKAEIVRSVIAANKNKKQEEVVELAMKKTGMKKALCTVYVKNNWTKATQPKKASKKKTVVAEAAK